MANQYIKDLSTSMPLRESVIREAIRTLKPPAGSRGLDAGCGIGTLAFLLAKAVGPRGHVTGIDIASESVDYAREQAEKSGFGQRVAFERGDVNNLPFGDGAFDWAWSVDCVGYSPQTPFSAVRKLKRAVKPGGTVAILFWSSQQLLPGYPELEARLNATGQGIAPFTRHSGPESHPLRAAGRFREAGLKHVRTRTFAGDVCAPLTVDIRDALVSLIRMRWGDEPELDRENRARYKRLCNPESPDFIIDSPDYYAFFTYSMFMGDVP